MEGVGAVGLPVPPVGTVYHNKLDPLAVSGEAVAFLQYVTGETTVGGGVVAVTITLKDALGLSQPLTVWLT